MWEEDGAVVGVLATTEELTVNWINQLYVLPGWTEGELAPSCCCTHMVHCRSRFSCTRSGRTQELGGSMKRNGYKAIEFTDGQDNEEMP
ncbi:MAG: hypothetical protein MZW92_48995 [Comamonadaceae bacterium]|nr:hypothetical protein [Comamonadaceae bacterium]